MTHETYEDANHVSVQDALSCSICNPRGLALADYRELLDRGLDTRYADPGEDEDGWGDGEWFGGDEEHDHAPVETRNISGCDNGHYRHQFCSCGAEFEPSTEYFCGAGHLYRAVKAKRST